MFNMLFDVSLSSRSNLFKFKQAYANKEQVCKQGNIQIFLATVSD